MKKGTLVKRSPHEAFRLLALEAVIVLSASPHTRRAYMNDASKWISFCEGRRLDPVEATAIVAAAWVEEMRRNDEAPKTRSRRMSALSSIYDWLRRNKKVTSNPFSITEGPKREAAHVLKPTPIAAAQTVLAAIQACEANVGFEDLRDAAIMRILWVTGARRSSLVEITRERLALHDGAFTCTVPAKGGKTVKLWFTGRAAEALGRWLDHLDGLGLTRGSVFRLSSGRPMAERDIWRAVRRRGQEVGGKLMPHSFRVAFLTINPASLDERQDAAGHSSPETTRGYDRKNWRGQKAFALMPEVEEVVASEGDTHGAS